MKKVTIISISLLFLLFLIMGCSKKENSSPTSPNTTTAGTMTAKVNGADWNANTGVVGTYENNIFTVTGQASPGGTQSEQIQIIVQGITAPGTFALSMFGNTGRMSVATSQTNITTYLTLDNNAGTVTVTELSANSAKGTFSFTAKNANNPGEVKTIENGSFSVTY